MDDANVPSLLAMPYLKTISAKDPVYRNTRKLVWSQDNPFFFKGKAGEGIGGPHIGYDMIWPMSIIMRAFTADNDGEIRQCIRMLRDTDGGTGLCTNLSTKIIRLNSPGIGSPGRIPCSGN